MLTTSPNNFTVLLHRLMVIPVVMCLSACSGPSGYVPLSNGDTWQEEVLLHDGKKIVAERTTVRGGRHEAGQKGDYVAQSMRFTLPGGSQHIEWEDTRINGIGNSSFLPMALDVVKGTPYIVANTMGCLAYNQWGRPNPPYVIFKFEANAWTRIPMEALPLEVKTPNLVQSMPDLMAAKEPKRFVTAQRIAQIVGEYRQAEYRSVLREPVNYDPSCIPMVTNGKGLWLAEGRFKKKPSFDACLASCKSENFDETTCPCNRLFKDQQPANF